MVKVKICGITNRRDAKFCSQFGADFLGMIVNIPHSPRSIKAGLARDILASLPESTKGIAVMAPNSFKELVETIDIIRPWGVQLHGGEDLEFIVRASSELSCKVIKVIHIRGVESLNEAQEFSRVSDFLLLDTASKELGGSGLTHNWDISSDIVNKVDINVFLAGGLNPRNVGEAIERVLPFCVDTSSGVERSPGIKDNLKVKQFIERVKDFS